MSATFPSRSSTPSIDPRLATLGRLYDIELEYVDVFGNVHAASEPTIRAILVAMGVDLERRSIDELILERQRNRWTRALAPVQVVREDDVVQTLLQLPDDQTFDTYTYALTLEDGETLSGHLSPKDLSVIERATLAGRSYTAYGWTLPRVPLGYHRLELSPSNVGMQLIVTPAECFVPEIVAREGRAWGVTLQLYGLRTARNWGIGDFSDLRAAIEQFAEQGAAVVGVNPLHALFPHDPSRISPYSPSSRMFLNVLYLDIEAIPEFSQCAQAQQHVYTRDFQRRLERLRACEQVDYAAVANLKHEVSEILYRYFREHHLARDTKRANAFREFQRSGGDALHRHTVYEALQEFFHRNDPTVWGWPAWPAAYRRPDAPEVSRWAEEHRERVEYYQYLQWHADQQMASVGRRSYDLGLGIGLYQDLAVGVGNGGAETWAWQSAYARDINIGAPPDEYSPNGQDWGLPPLNPARLRDIAYAPFVATLRANMRHGGAVRLDHVMGLLRLYWVPAGMSPKAGAYVRYPLNDLLGILALESQRNHCLVIGEDLGTVPAEIRRELPRRRIHSYRLLIFEHSENGELKPPPDYPERALAAVTTHDLPTLTGYWKGQDILERERLKLLPSEDELERQILVRAQDRVRLLMALAREQLLPDDMTVDPAWCPEMTDDLARAVYAYLARTPSKIALVGLEDAVGDLCQPNLPGTVDEYPNWRRKIALDLESIVEVPRARSIFGVMRDARGIGTLPRPKAGSGGEQPIPNATYRLQFHRDFTFRQAATLCEYFERLGISHCYASPYLKARPGSRHGYDIVDHNALNPEIGSPEDYDVFVAALHRHGLGQILDIVPNHMGVGSDNHWWLDVLENGPASVYAPFFDIDWRPLKAELRGKVLLPVLGDHYGRVLENGELRLAWDNVRGSLHAEYYDHRFPLDPMTYAMVLDRDMSELERSLGTDHRRFVEYQSIIAGFRNLPGRSEREPDRLSERNRDKDIHKKRLADLCAMEPLVERHVVRLVERYNGSESPARDALHELLEQQAYRLAFWRVASDEINYRRFFDINDLAALRMENAQTFYTTHRLISDLIAQGKVNGLRIDHPDGLYDPPAYYERLQAFVTSAVATSGAAPARSHALYVVVEKILASYEHLPIDWPVHGTTGYEFVNLVNGVFVDANAEEALDRTYTRFVRREVDFDQLLADRKRLIMRFALSSELNVLANYLNRLSEADRFARDFTLHALRDALREVIAFFPVYRTYIRYGRLSPEDRRYIDWAVAQAKKHSMGADTSALEYVRGILLLENIDQLPESYREGVLNFIQRFQQYTSPVMAKGLEDTTFYIYHRLVSLNEVGGDPRRFGVSVAQFHRGNQDRAKRFPHSMLATSTHDTKRSEDVRARINVLSEVAREWHEAVNRWGRINRRKKRKLEDGYAPDRNDEYLLYQTLVGAWPLESPEGGEALDAFRERIEAYMLKAIREAKIHTSWINPNVPYEEGVVEFVRALLGTGTNLFLQDFVPFCRRLVRPGLCNSLSQTLLKMTAPGVPDIYQGNELWDFSLVDPDNRRPVDYMRRVALLDELSRSLETPTPEGARALLDNIEDGRAKLFVVWKALAMRRVLPDVFRDGDYLPLTVEGTRAEHLCAFARRHTSGTVVIVVPRCIIRLREDGDFPLGAVWQETRVEVPCPGRYFNSLTGEEYLVPAAERAELRAQDVFRSFPVALLRLVP